MQTFAAHWHPIVEITQLGRHGIEDRETRKITFGTHTGTHIDAPLHFIPHGKSVDKIPIEKLIGKATVVNLSFAKNRQEITPSDLEVAIGNRSMERLLVRFDWHKQWGNRDYYVEHPYLSEDACQWIVDHGCILLALDTPQPDNPQSPVFGSCCAPNHKILLGNEVVLVEYLTNTDKIKQDEIFLMVSPLNIMNADGAPARVVALEKE
jgi:arylformamidase